MKIKITPIKSEELCYKCKFGTLGECRNHPNCYTCPRCDRKAFPARSFCECNRIKIGNPCPYFVKAEGVGGAADEQ